MRPSTQSIAAGLMILSGLTHPAQVVLFDLGPEAAQSARGGSIFLLVGLGLLTRFKLALAIGIALPLLGGVSSVVRIVNGDPTTLLTPVHAAIDFVVVGLCIASLWTRRPASARVPK
jgi:hypothetical protein